MRMRLRLPGLNPQLRLRTTSRNIASFSFTKSMGGDREVAPPQPVEVEPKLEVVT